MSEFNAFLENAQSGDFNFGSNVYGWFDKSNPNSPVLLEVHGEERLAYDSLEDCYRHYVEDKPVPYNYACLLGERDENGEISSENDDFNALLKRQKPVDDSDEREIWSDLVRVESKVAYSQRETPVCYQGDCLA